MSQANDLYQQVILDHNRSPRNFRMMADATHVCDGHNPLCGDHITLFAKVDAEGVLQDISFQGKGCAISKASASMMTAALKGKTLADVKQFFDEFHGMATGELDTDTQPNHLGKLTLFKGVKEYSSRIKCATLGWHALMGALERKTETSSEN